MYYNNVELYNITELIPYEQGGHLMSRIPDELRMNVCARESALNGSGCEIRFNMESDSVKIKLKRLNYDYYKFPTSVVEVYFGCFQGDASNSPQFVSLEPTEIIITRPANMENMEMLSKKYKLPYDSNLVRVFLPYDWSACLLGIEGEVSPPRPGQTPQKKYLAYGSSISHGAFAIRPTGTFAAKTARAFGVELVNLGFQGSGCLEKEMADYIAQRNDWDIATLEIGANLFFGDNLTTEIIDKVDYFISRIAKSHTGKWIFCIDILTKGLENNDQIQEFRDIVRKKVEALMLPRLVYVSGLDIIRSITSISSDMCHPSADGEDEMARNLISIMQGYFTVNESEGVHG